MFSEVAFDRDQVNSSCSPCSDFLVRSCLNHTAKNNQSSTSTVLSQARKSVTLDHNDRDLESAVVLDMTLIFLWKAFVVQENGQMKIVVGQHHVAVDRLNTLATSHPQGPPTPPPNPATIEYPVLKFVRRDSALSDLPLTPSPEVSTRLVTYSFSHDHQKEHQFSRGLCVVPVTLTLQNHSERPLQAVVDTSKTPESLSTAQTGVSAGPSDGRQTEGGGDSLAPDPPSSVNQVHLVNRWVGLTQASLSLDKGHHSTVSLKAGFTRPGTYNLNNLSVFVTYSSNSSTAALSQQPQQQMVLQKHSTPSIITLVDTS